MSNVCLKTIKFSTAPVRPSIGGSISPHTAFFSRFYSFATAAVRNQWQTCHRYQHGEVQRLPKRCFHDSSTSLKRHAPGKAPRKETAAQRARGSAGPLSTARKAASALGDLPQDELTHIFGSPISPEVGNNILQTLHYRRIIGSLIEHGLNVDDTTVSWESREKALAWLREKHPVDEKTTAAEWANRAAEKLQESYISRAEQFNLIRKRSKDEVRQQKDSLPPSATSVFDRIRAKNEEKARQEAQKRRESGEEQRSNELRLAKLEDQRTKEGQRQVALEKRKEDLMMAGRVTNMTEEEIRGALTTSQRLLPSTVFVILVIIAALFGAETYTPPEQSTRVWQDLPPSVATLTAILGTCVTVTCCWYLPIFQRKFNQFLLVSPAWPYWFSMLGNTFSHQSFIHLGANTLGLVLYGISLHESIGRGNFVAIYSTGGVVGSIVSLYSHVLRGDITKTHMGASGCLWAVMVAWAILRYSSNADHEHDSRWQTALDITRYMVLTLQIIPHFSSSIRRTVDGAAHAGGALAGLVAAWLLQARSKEVEVEDAKEVKTLIS